MMFGHWGWFVSPFSVCVTLCGSLSWLQNRLALRITVALPFPGAGLASDPVSGAHFPWVVHVLCCRRDCSCCIDENGEAQGSLTWGRSPDWNPGSPTLVPSAPCPSLGCTTGGYEPAEVHVAPLLPFWHDRTSAPSSSAVAQSDGASVRREPSVESQVTGALGMALSACVGPW